MVPVNSVQREPSMEEILASIRRIIEDSDTTRKTVEEEADAASGQASDEDAFRAELAPEGQAATEEAAPEIQEATPPNAGALLAEEGPDAGDAVPGAVHSASSEIPAPAASPPDAAQEEEPAMEFDMAELDSGNMNGAKFDLPAQASNGTAEQAGAPSRTAITSERVGRQVAATFGELSEAFAARSRRSFDEIAEEMMRPMLQDWLDNNLPHLVERLVREEIERIARGTAAPR